jgi:hypothetical protein
MGQLLSRTLNFFGKTLHQPLAHSYLVTGGAGNDGPPIELDHIADLFKKQLACSRVSRLLDD